MKYLVYIFLLFYTFCATAHHQNAVLKVGDKAPDFTIKNPEGKDLHLSSLKGKVVLLDFWASWCMPCRMANPDLVDLYRNYNHHGFEIFSVSLDSKKNAWTSAIENDELYWPYHGSELVGWDSKVGALYGVDALPFSFLIDENGTIIALDLDAYYLEKKLKQLLIDQIHFYPSKASTKIVFTKETKYEIYNASHVVVLKGKGLEASIAHLPDGNYTVKYDGKTEVLIKKTNPNSKSPITFYPTRVADVITFSKETNYQIYNFKGKLEIEGKATQVNVAHFKSGVYYLCIDGEINSFFKK
jgi:thiol-disulfide isomerase/thioredoxin